MPRPQKPGYGGGTGVDAFALFASLVERVTTHEEWLRDGSAPGVLVSRIKMTGEFYVAVQRYMRPLGEGKVVVASARDQFLYAALDQLRLSLEKVLRGSDFEARATFVDSIVRSDNIDVAFNFTSKYPMVQESVYLDAEVKERSPRRKAKTPPREPVEAPAFARDLDFEESPAPKAKRGA